MQEDSIVMMDRFQRLKVKLNRLVEPLAQTEGLTTLQGYVLTLIGRGEMSVGALSLQTGMGQANTSTLCKKLEQGGYITRTRGPKDERTVLLNLTERGRKAFLQIQNGIEGYKRELDAVSPEGFAEVLRGICTAEKLIDHLLDQIEGAQGIC